MWRRGVNDRGVRGSSYQATSWKIRINQTAHADHHHDDAVASVSLTSDAPLDMERFNGWISAVLAEKGQDLLRTKGILHFRGNDQRFAFQAVHMLADGDFIGGWKDGAPRASPGYGSRECFRTPACPGSEELTGN